MESIFRIRDDIENLFKYPILFQFFVSLLVIVVTGFQAIVLPAAEGGLLIYFYCSGVFFQLFSICWFTNQVMEEVICLVLKYSQSKLLNTTAFLLTYFGGAGRIQLPSSFCFLLPFA